MNWPLVMLLALGIDALVGWPDALLRRIGHPVIWIGGLISRLDRRFNREIATPSRRRLAGAVSALAVIAITGAIAAVVLHVLPEGALGVGLAALLAAPWIAARSLHVHVAPVAMALIAQDTPAARRAVARIVGRDPERLAPPAIARAALESLAENASDGVVAPLFWGALLGLPGLAAYKAINTLDSMIGHRSARHLDFGRFAARLDDAVNYVPARLTALTMALLAPHPSHALAQTGADAPHHRSPNAGWPEAAMAAALGRRLSGPRAYDAEITFEPWLNAAAPDPDGGDIRHGLALYRRAMVAIGSLLGLAALLHAWIAP